MLRKKQKTEFLKRLTLAVGEALKRAEPEWTAQELSTKTGISASRLSEYKNFQKYKRAIPEKDLLTLILKGVVDVEELKKCAGDENEKEFFNEIMAIESQELRKQILEVQRAGIDVGKILEEVLKGLKGE